MGLRTQTRTDAERPSQAPGPIIIGDNKYIVTGTIGLKKIAVSNLIGLVPITSVFAKGPRHLLPVPRI